MIITQKPHVGLHHRGRREETQVVTGAQHKNAEGERGRMNAHLLLLLGCCRKGEEAQREKREGAHLDQC